jgi:hypothetical protein
MDKKGQRLELALLEATLRRTQTNIYLIDKLVRHLNNGL